MAIALENNDIIADNVRIEGNRKTVGIDLLVMDGKRYIGDVVVFTDRACIELNGFDKVYTEWTGKSEETQDFKDIVNRIDAAAREAKIQSTVRAFELD